MGDRILSILLGHAPARTRGNPATTHNKSARTIPGGPRPRAPRTPLFGSSAGRTYVALRRRECSTSR